MKPTLLFLACLLVFPAAGNAAPPDDFDVVWDSPSADHHGSMPLGNGDVAVNAWFTRDGDLQFYISKTDAWDDNARLVKVGKVRVHLDPNPVVPGRRFRQELRLRAGTLEITAGDPGAAAATVVRLWVDANHPVIHVTADGPAPTTATASVELWRTNRQEVAELQISDVMMNPEAPGKKQGPTVTEPDVVLSGLPGRIGWYHHNTKSVGPRELAELQGLEAFARPDPLLHRTFGAVITTPKGERVDDLHLRSPQSVSHRFDVHVLARHPSTPTEWQAAMDETIRAVGRRDPAALRRDHERWWEEFWNRSWIRASEPRTTAGAAPSWPARVPTNGHPVRVGMDQGGANRFAGELGRISVRARALGDAEIAALAAADRNAPAAPGPASARILYNSAEPGPRILAGSAGWNLAAGVTVEAWVKPAALGAGGARIADKITPGLEDGFLLDTHPGNSLRFICGRTVLQQADALPPGQWTHVAAVADAATGECRLYANGRRVADGSGPGGGGDPAALVSRMYHLQRFVTACAGRGAYPIKFNGSLFTVPPGPTEGDPDYRRWGPGYWWQNTRLPYISLNTSGDFDLQRPLFRMYADELLPLCKYRTKLYLGHDGAYYPECIMFWGDVFGETYGWTPFAKRSDKLQESGWHKWEWVGGLELCWMMMDYHDHTLDRGFLDRTALPFAREILTFFEQQYPTNAQGRLVMHPSQALETWWRCTNAAPEIAGCIAVTERLLALPAGAGTAADRALWRRLRDKLPPVPVREIGGRKALAAAEFFADRRNVENPELYPVFPFRLFAFNRPNPDWALAALEHRDDRGNTGWRQDDVFMAYLGLADDARKSLVGRARSHDRNERFPAFWGPNYDWTPDQDHGGILMKGFQSMLLQTDGQRIYLLPAWPKGWDVDFKLHAPGMTVVEGLYRNGRMERLRTTPASRARDVVQGEPR